MTNEQTTILHDLALTLGTTTEYLWGVLIAQAPIAAIIEIVQNGFIAVFLALSLYAVYWVREWDDDAVVAPIILSTLLTVMLVISISANLSTVVTGFFHPEYWALKEILDVLE